MEAGKPGVFQKEGWHRAVKYDGDRTFGPELKTQEEKDAANKIAAVIKDIPGLQAKEMLETFAEMPADRMKLLADNPALAEIWFDPKLSQHQKKLKTLPFLRKYKDEIAKLQKDRNKTAKRLDLLKATEVGAEFLLEWQKKQHGLEKNDCSRLHKLVTAITNEEVFFSEDFKPKELEELLLKDVHPFVVQNDWAKAFENASDYAEGEITLPYNICAFEFRISGVTVIVLALQPEDASVALVGFAEANDVWFCNGKDCASEGPFQLAWNEIRAICIALEAECAVKELMRAPAKLNRAREEAGKLPLYSYHVVKLSERHRVSARHFGGTHKSPRLHFRRGHWRHFASHKTWIKWMLVGDPELGFIDKEYRL